MKFFTPDLLERFGSADPASARQAHDQLEENSERYARQLASLETKLPPRFWEMQERFYLHDARLLRPVRLTDPGENDDSIVLLLRLDTPPHELLVLHYRQARMVSVLQHQIPEDDRCPYTEWLHDEVEALSEGEFEQAILFTNGVEARLRFGDFDFATLRPL